MIHRWELYLGVTVVLLASSFPVLVLRHIEDTWAAQLDRTIQPTLQSWRMELDQTLRQCQAVCHD